MAKQPTYLSWTAKKNPALGKLKLASMECSGIFFTTWVHYIAFDAGYKDIDASPFPVSPYTLNRNSTGKRVSVPGRTTMVRGSFTDCIGDQLGKDISYTVKIYLWVETTEEANGIAFDVQKEANDNLKHEQ
jgi:hypothetical protein